MKSLEIDVPEGLFAYITKLVEEKKFDSVETFLTHASHWLAELYGFGKQSDGKSLSGLIVDLIVSNVGKEEKQVQQEETDVTDLDIPNKDLIMESYGSSKFMFEDAIFASCQFAALKQGNQPLSKEEFLESLQKMKEAGILVKITQGEKLMWKRTD